MKIRKSEILKKGAAIVLACSTLFTAYPGLAQAKNDMRGHWAEQNIRTLKEQGLISGYADGSFQPNKAITRAEFIAGLNKLLGLTGEIDFQFKDVDNKDWFSKQVAIAMFHGYIKGYEDGTFRPNAPISRLEAAVMIARANKLAEKLVVSEEDLNILQDKKSVPNWAKKELSLIIKSGIMKGDLNQVFHGESKITRAEAVVSLGRAKEVKETLEISHQIQSQKAPSAPAKTVQTPKTMPNPVAAAPSTPKISAPMLPAPSMPKIPAPAQPTLPAPSIPKEPAPAQPALPAPAPAPIPDPKDTKTVSELVEELKTAENNNVNGFMFEGEARAIIWTKGIAAPVMHEEGKNGGDFYKIPGSGSLEYVLPYDNAAKPGWYDTDKSKDKASVFCSGAVAANMLHWWYDQNKNNIDAYFTTQKAKGGETEVEVVTSIYGVRNMMPIIILRPFM